MKYKKIAFFIMVFVFVIQAMACKTNSNNNQQKDTIITNSQETTADLNSASNENAAQSNDTEDSAQIVDEPLSAKENSSDSNSVEPIATKELSIYTMNESTLEVEVVPALVPADKEITPQVIVDLVTDSFADRLITIGIDKVSTDGDKVIISFLSNQPPATNVGSGIEETILNAYAQSLVDNLKDYKKVIFRIEGKPYSNGHFDFGLNQVYLDASASEQ